LRADCKTGYLTLFLPVNPRKLIFSWIFSKSLKNLLTKGQIWYIIKRIGAGGAQVGKHGEKRKANRLSRNIWKMKNKRNKTDE